MHKAQAIPQIAIVYPASYLKESNSPFSPNTNALQGILYALLDNQFCAEILMEHHLPGKIQNYPMIIVPECKSMDAATKQMLVDYVKTGGNLLVSGAGVASIFKEELGINSFEKSEEKQIFINAANRLGAVRSVILETKPGNEVEILSKFYTGNDLRDELETGAATVAKIGKGNIGAIYFDAGNAYQQYKSMVIRDFLGETVSQLFSNPMVKTDGSKLVHVAANTKNGKTYISLINVAGEHTNQSAIGYDQVPALTDLKVSIASKNKPAKIVMQPGGKEMEFSYSNGVSTLVVPKIEVHTILEIQN